MTSESSKPSILVLGGLGFIGRNFITYLVENELASEIKVVDKVLTETAGLNTKQEEAYQKVEVLQRNLANPTIIESIFKRKDGSSYDYVFNLAAETKYSQNERIYEERIFNLSVRNAKEAAKCRVKVFVEVSTAEIYHGDRNPSKEDEKIKPWTAIAKYKHKAEEELKKIEGLNLVILRPAIVYGPGATIGIKMKFLWSKDLKINTVHVLDVSRAMWHIAEWYQANEKAGKGTLIYNLADMGNTESNEKHMRPWSELLKKNKIRNTPLSPYLDKELLYNNSLSVDGKKIVNETGFNYEIPEVTDVKLQEIVDDFINLNLWPAKD
ncbi:7845_t:CDS:2 [Entrophospora sp. SA101]|nr:7577_t:CDS:2 [Entrophospora sp. SA101]CAJ0628732.1 7845_t:CDS:2 [Entrophospora sp. SA101]